MAELKASRTGQYLMVAEFKWNFNDEMVDSAGATIDFGASDVAGFHAFDVINLPRDSVVVGGDVVGETTFDTAGYDIKVGDSASDDRYLTSTDLKTAARTPLVPTGYRNTGALPIRVSVQSDDACTAGVMTLRVFYTIENRANETIPYQP